MISRETFLAYAPHIGPVAGFFFGHYPISTAAVIGASILGGGSVLAYKTRSSPSDCISASLLSGTVTATGIAAAKLADALPYDESPLNSTVKTGVLLLTGVGSLAAHFYIDSKLREEAEDERMWQQFVAQGLEQAADQFELLIQQIEPAEVETKRLRT